MDISDRDYAELLLCDEVILTAQEKYPEIPIEHIAALIEVLKVIRDEEF